jgi:CRP-like cAMP-binding protein
MKQKARSTFDPKAFLAKVGKGREQLDYQKNQRVFSQGDAADAIFYIQKGSVKLTVVSGQGKEAVVAILGASSFFGEGCLAGQSVRMASAVTMSHCSIMRLKKQDVTSVLHEEPAFTELFLQFVRHPDGLKKPMLTRDEAQKLVRKAIGFTLIWRNREGAQPWLMELIWVGSPLASPVVPNWRQ